MLSYCYFHDKKYNNNYYIKILTSPSLTILLENKILLEI